jgi:hypothetical protein
VFIKRILKIFVYIFSAIGFVLMAGFVAVRFHLTDVAGEVDRNNLFFQKSAESIHNNSEVRDGEIKKNDLSISGVSQEIERLNKIKNSREEYYCKVDAIGSFFPQTAKRIIEAGKKTTSDPIVQKMAAAAEMKLLANSEYVSRLEKCRNLKNYPADFSNLEDKFKESSGKNAFLWADSPEWQTIKVAVTKDKDIINKAAREAGIEPRLIVANMAVEQLRLMNSEREVFKRFFDPLKILCSANKISLGVMGIKEETAEKIENNLKEKNSQYYLGQEFERLLDFQTGDISSERYDKLSSEKNHYYSYLYGALYIRQIMKQWEAAGFPIAYRPEIIGTLFNVGFPQSKPKANPQVGGSKITCSGEEYSFGRLAYEIYYSGELMDEFPYEIK